jgi:hypothetical protein
MKTYGGVDEKIHVFSTSVLVAGEWLASRSGRFTSGERVPRIHGIGDWVDPRAGLDVVEKRPFLTLLELDLLPLGRPARSQLLYRLRYLGSQSVPIVMSSVLWLFNNASSFSSVI